MANDDWIDERKLEELKAFAAALPQKRIDGLRRWGLMAHFAQQKKKAAAFQQDAELADGSDTISRGTSSVSDWVAEQLQQREDYMEAWAEGRLGVQYTKPPRAVAAKVALPRSSPSPIARRWIKLRDSEEHLASLREWGEEAGRLRRGSGYEVK